MLKKAMEFAGLKRGGYAAPGWSVAVDPRDGEINIAGDGDQLYPITASGFRHPLAAQAFCVLAYRRRGSWTACVNLVLQICSEQDHI